MPKFFQQKIKNNESVVPGGLSKPFNVYQDPTLPEGVSQADIEGTAAIGKFLLGVGDQLSGQNTIKEDNYQVRIDQRRYVFTPLENFAYDVGRRATDGAQSGLSDLWKHRPQFDIPAIKIPKFDLPKLPNFEIPRIPEFNPQPKTKEPVQPGQPKPTVPEPQPQPEPQIKEKDIPISDKNKTKYPTPNRPPGSQRFRKSVIKMWLIKIIKNRSKLCVLQSLPFLRSCKLWRRYFWKLKLYNVNSSSRQEHHPNNRNRHRSNLLGIQTRQTHLLAILQFCSSRV